MAWYDIPKVKVSYLYDDAGKQCGVIFAAADFKKLMDKLEDFYDIEMADAIEQCDKSAYAFKKVFKQLGLDDE